MYCRHESVSFPQEDRLRCWSLTRLDSTDRPESRKEQKQPISTQESPSHRISRHSYILVDTPTSNREG